MKELILRKALESGKRLRIIYISNDSVTERVIKIKKIENENIYAYCYLRKADRIFVTENILSAVIVESGQKNEKN